jgi:hypothetical protein
MLQSPQGPIVEGRLPGEGETLPAFLRLAIAKATSLKWCFIAEFCVFFILGLSNLYLILIPWIGIVGWFAVNSLQPLTLAIVGSLQIAISFLGAVCLGMQISSDSSYGVCKNFFDVSRGDRMLGRTLLVVLTLIGMSAVGSFAFRFRTQIIRNLAREDRARLIALS